MHFDHILQMFDICTGPLRQTECNAL